MRWLLWFLLVPQLFLLQGLLRTLQLPPVDVPVALCLFLAWFAEPRAVAVLLLGAALGRAMVDEAGLWVQVLVLGAPVAVLLPLRRFLFRQRWLWQGAAAAFVAVALPKLAQLFGAWFDQPSAGAALDGSLVAWAAVSQPAVLWLLRRLPPLQPFAEREGAA